MSQVDPWEKAADCARALATTSEPAKRDILTDIGNLWIALANDRRFLSAAELANQIEAIGRMHAEWRSPGRYGAPSHLAPSHLAPSDLAYDLRDARASLSTTPHLAGAFT
jgi:hypothetical protein